MIVVVVADLRDLVVIFILSPGYWPAADDIRDGLVCSADCGVLMQEGVEDASRFAYGVSALGTLIGTEGLQ